MLKLLRLEYLFNLRQLLIILAIFSVYFSWAVNQIEKPGVFIVTTSLMVGLGIPFAIVGREDKFKTAALVCSLPVRRSTVVLSKFAATWAAILLGLGYNVFLTAVLPFSKVPLGDVLSVKNLLVSLFLMSLLFAVILPFTIRFGIAGIIILLVGLQLLGIVALFLTQMLGGAGSPLRLFFRAVEGGLKFLLHHQATPGFLLTLAAGIVAVNFLSITVSRALYARRDL
jgi:ABC-type transport system involved in multi-copper enzyme maturation permease subunit